MRIQFTADEIDEALLERLRDLDEDALKRILARRPDALARPWPRRLTDLARRLGGTSVWFALRQVATPGFQLLGALQVCTALCGDEPVTTARLAGLVDGTVDQVDDVLRDLSELALAWTDREGRVRVADALSDDFGYGAYGFGPPLRELASRATVEQLKRINAALDLPTTGRKQQLIDALQGLFAQPDSVRELVDRAPGDARELLLDAAWHGSHIGAHVNYLFYLSNPRPRTTEDEAVALAIRHGLLWPSHDGGVLPLEAGLALRGPGYRLPFTPDPPRLDTAPVSPESVATECAAAALRMVDRVNNVLTSAAADPIPLLKSGRVGVRAVRGLAKSMSATAEEVRLAVELACAAGLLMPAEPPEPEPSRGRKGRSRSKRPEPPPAPEGIVPTEEAAHWRAEGSAGRLGLLLETWWNLDAAPLADDKAVRAVLGNEPSDAFADIRHRTVELISTLDSSSGVTGGVAELLSWQVPMLTEDLLNPVVDATLAEAELLGVVNSGAPGELAHSMAGGASSRDDPVLAKATDSLVSAARTSALFGSDLTAIVTGSAETELSSLLDSAADREAQGSASTWRFSPASVRRAFDNGATAAGLIEQLSGVAQSELPQPLVYLVNDVARKHGRLGVIDVRCVIVSDDATLLTEVAAHRKLSGLGLHQLAPTVLASRSAAADTLEALRDAGYAPVPRDADGSITVTREQPAPQGAPAQQSGPFMVIGGELVELDDVGELPRFPDPDPAEHAARLVGTATEPSKRMTRGDLVDHLHRMGDRYRAAEWYRLAWRLEAGGAAIVDYRGTDGSTVTLRIRNPEWHGDALNVWSVEDDDYRTLELARITPA